jgi:hypothetical protein
MEGKAEMKKAILLSAALMILFVPGCKNKQLGPEPPECANVAVFTDADLAEKVRQAIGKPAGHPICVIECEAMRNFDARSLGISALSGMENCKNLLTLELYDNIIADAGAL